MTKTDVIRPLRRGDLVALAATARKVSPEEMAPAVRLLESWGLRVLQPEHLYDASNQFAGSDEVRAATMQRLLDDAEVRAIICVRGGYGTVRMVDGLDWSRFEQCPKWIVGYSDVTVLHSHVHARLSMPTLHATMPINIPDDACVRPYPAVEALRKALFGKELGYEFDGHPLNRPGECEGVLVGGNLSILYSLCGSPSDINTDGKILFIEDLDEYLYHIDRMMMNLKRCGKLAGLKGLVVGAMSDMHDNAIPFGRTAEEIISNAVEEYGYPVCFNAPFGHIGMENGALVLGANVHLVVPNQKKLVSLHF